MSDNKKIKRPLDAKRINVNEPYEVKYWTKQLDVSYQKLHASVKQVGTSVEKVKEYIKKTT